MPHVSILLQTYNQARYLSESIDSLLQQTFQDFEIFVIDDCSPDRTAQVMKRFESHSRVTFIRNERNMGQHASTNLHLKRLSGDLVLFASGDDVYYPLFLERAVHTFNACPTAGLVHVNACIISSSGRKLGLISDSAIYPPEVRAQLSHDYFLRGSEFCQWLLRANLVASHSACLVKRSSVKRTGPFDEQLPQVADWDMWFRIALEDDVAYLSEPLIGWRRHDSSATVSFQKSGESSQDMVRLASKLLTQYPRELRAQVENQPYILISAFVGSALEFNGSEAAELVRQHLLRVMPRILEDYRYRHILIRRLAVHVWYRVADQGRAHRDALVAIEKACNLLPDELRRGLPKEAVTHYWALDAYKEWRRGSWQHTPYSAFRAFLSSPAYLVDLFRRYGRSLRMRAR